MHKKEKHTLTYPEGLFNPADWLRFIHLPPFDKKWGNLGLDDDDLRLLQILIMASPDKYPVIRGTRGLRKLRFARQDSNLSKRESFRVCYSFFPAYGIVVLVTVFAKSETDDLNTTDKKAITAILHMIETRLDEGTIR
jgi:hypothetical protein